MCPLVSHQFLQIPGVHVQGSISEMKVLIRGISEVKMTLQGIGNFNGEERASYTDVLGERSIANKQWFTCG